MFQDMVALEWFENLPSLYPYIPIFLFWLGNAKLCFWGRIL